MRGAREAPRLSAQISALSVSVEAVPLPDIVKTACIGVSGMVLIELSA